MLSDSEITNLIDANEFDAAFNAVNERIAENQDDDAAWFLRGKAHWKLGSHALAITDYQHAVAINPDSNARHALEMSQDIINFFNPDLLNP